MPDSWVHETPQSCFPVAIPDIARQAGWKPEPLDLRIRGVCHVRRPIDQFFRSSDGGLYALGRHLFEIDRHDLTARWIDEPALMEDRILDVVAGRVLFAPWDSEAPGLTLSGRPVPVPESLGPACMSCTRPGSPITAVGFAFGLAALDHNGDVAAVCDLRGRVDSPDLRQWKQSRIILLDDRVILEGDEVLIWDYVSDALLPIARRADVECVLGSQFALRRRNKRFSILETSGKVSYRWVDQNSDHVEHAALWEGGLWMACFNPSPYREQNGGGLTQFTYKFDGCVARGGIQYRYYVGDLRVRGAVDARDLRGSFLALSGGQIVFIDWATGYDELVARAENSEIWALYWSESSQQLLVAGWYGDVYAIDLKQTMGDFHASLARWKEADEIGE
ncbi:hypothetical protein SH412_002222 [Planctellipticum variicoloris]|nr:hypothetical protein SH412_002222 [Planctomycetaceae bacterium SH412]